MGEPRKAAEQPPPDAVRVCPEKDIECGRNADRWCAACPLRAPAAAAQATAKISA